MEQVHSRKKAESELFGEHLRFLRTSKTEMSQLQIAKELNLDRSTYTKYELGVVQPDIFILKKLAKLFGISVDALIGFESNKYIQ